MKCLDERSSSYEKLIEGQAGYLFLAFYKNNPVTPATILWHSAEMLSLNYDLLIKSSKKSWVRINVVRYVWILLRTLTNVFLNENFLSALNANKNYAS